MVKLRPYRIKALNSLLNSIYRINIESGSSLVPAVRNDLRINKVFRIFYLVNYAKRLIIEF